MLEELKHHGVKFRSLTKAIDTDTHTSRAMWRMICVLAELERSLIDSGEPVQNVAVLLNVGRVTLHKPLNHISCMELSR